MMDPKKGINDTTENDPQPTKSNEDSTGIGRTYDCTFCKRGFTNAQALGGHMNIHRKDKAKAKAKQKNQEETSMKANLNSWNFPHQISPNDQQYYGLMGSQMNYQMYFPSGPSPNPNFQIGNNYGTNAPVLRPDDRFEDENLSLKIGLPDPTVGNDEDDENVKESEVDLELRLGHDP